mgnify:CR=1 FL=1
MKIELTYCLQCLLYKKWFYNVRILLRPTEYKILFDSLARNAEDAELGAEARMFEQCREMVNTIAQAADNMMDAQYIENFDGDITG